MPTARTIGGRPSVRLAPRPPRRGESRDERGVGGYLRRGFVLRGAFTHSGHVVGKRRNRNAVALRPALGGGSSACRRAAAATRSMRSRVIVVGSSDAR